MTKEDKLAKGYATGKRQVKNELMLKLKDEGIVKPLKDSVCCNRKLSSQEQQELCAWIECAIDFGENLDECAKELELLKAKTQWHKLADADLPKENKPVIAIYNFIDELVPILTLYRDKKWVNIFQNYTDIVHPIIAWKEIVLPEIPKEVKEI